MRPQSKRIRDQKRAEAEVRLKLYSKRTTEEQLALIDQRPGESKRERKVLGNE